MKATCERVLQFWGFEAHCQKSQLPFPHAVSLARIDIPAEQIAAVLDTASTRRAAAVHRQRIEAHITQL